MIYYAFFIAVCLILVVVTIAGKDYWPFSHYPMFSVEQKLEDVKIWRLALEDKHGNIEWWQSRFFRYPEFTGRKLQKIYNLNVQGKKLTAFVNIERDRLLKSVLKLIDKEYTGNTYTAIHIIERTVSRSLEVQEHTIDIVPIAQLNVGNIK